MALLGKAAMLLSFDIAQPAIVEHDDWHTHEHFPERLSIPGFLRGSRWINREGCPRYFVMYEVADLDVLASTPYFERLNSPSPWTSRMMAHYQGMTRGLCRGAGSFGAGLAQAVLFIRFKPAAGKEASLRQWLLGEALPGLPMLPGLVGAHLFEGALAAPLTNEQRIRGKDAAVDCAVVIGGYDEAVLEKLGNSALNCEAFEHRGATGVSAGLYRMAYLLSKADVAA